MMPKSMPKSKDFNFLLEGRGGLKTTCFIVVLEVLEVRKRVKKREKRGVDLKRKKAWKKRGKKGEKGVPKGSRKGPKSAKRAEKRGCKNEAKKKERKKVRTRFHGVHGVADLVPKRDPLS